MARVCIFDVNETLLDLRALDPRFERVFGDVGARREWFLQLLQSALVATVTDAYADFGTIGRSALEMTAARRGVELSDEDRKLILGGMRELPPHREARESLERLRDARSLPSTDTLASAASAPATRASESSSMLVDLPETIPRTAMS